MFDDGVGGEAIETLEADAGPGGDGGFQGLPADLETIAPGPAGAGIDSRWTPSDSSAQPNASVDAS